MFIEVRRREGRRREEGWRALRRGVALRRAPPAPIPTGPRRRNSARPPSPRGRSRRAQSRCSQRLIPLGDSTPSGRLRPRPRTHRGAFFPSERSLDRPWVDLDGELLSDRRCQLARPDGFTDHPPLPRRTPGSLLGACAPAGTPLPWYQPRGLPPSRSSPSPGSTSGARRRTRRTPSPDRDTLSTDTRRRPRTSPARRRATKKSPGETSIAHPLLVNGFNVLSSTSDAAFGSLRAVRFGIPPPSVS